METISVVATGRVAREAGFARLLATELPAGYRTATLILRDPLEADDAVQDALVRAWQHWDGLRDEGRMPAWFGRILVNVCRDRLHARRSTIVAEVVDVPYPDDSEHSVDRDAMFEAIGRLTPEHRIVVVLRFYLDLPIDQIAARIGISEGTVKSRLHYALAQLRAAYEAQARIPEAVG